MIRISRQAEEFCRQNGAGKRTAYLISLTVEEACGNILRYGFCDKKAHQIDLRILKKKTGWILRLRDDCPLFNPVHYLDQFRNDAPEKNIGLKMLCAATDDIRYISTLKLNNLMICVNEAMNL